MKTQATSRSLVRTTDGQCATRRNSLPRELWNASKGIEVTTMPAVLPLILYVLAFVCFVIAAFWVNTPPARPNFVALGLASWVLAIILGSRL